MSDYFIGEIRMFGFNWAPSNWLICNGATLQIQQYKALYSLIGTSYGGNAQTTFNLPDLRGRVPLCQGIKAPYSYKTGNAGGAETVALTTATMPSHNHVVQASAQTANKPAIAGNYFAGTAPAVSTDTAPHPVYVTPSTTAVPLNNAMIGVTGGGAAHENRQPFGVVNFCISAIGIYPTRY